jgi:hypothetical protein
MKPTKGSRRRKLYNELYWLEEKGETFLERALDRMSALSPLHARQIFAFSLYFGLRGYAYSTLHNTGLRVGIATATAASWKNAVLSSLKHPLWQNEAQWPPIPIPGPMPDERVNENAVRLAAWRWRRIGTEAYNAELKQAAHELGIDKDEMGRFFARIGEYMVLKVT